MLFSSKGEKSEYGNNNGKGKSLINLLWAGTKGARQKKQSVEETRKKWSSRPQTHKTWEKKVQAKGNKYSGTAIKGVKPRIIEKT